MNIDNWQKFLELDVMSSRQARKLIDDDELYYVYIIWRAYTDPLIPFYVGKGRKYRFSQHEKYSKLQDESHKNNIIKKHKRLGIKPLYSIVQFFRDEQDALNLEIELIQLIGRHDLNSSKPLSNKTDGGDGTRGHLGLKGGDNPMARPVVANYEPYDCLRDAGMALNKSPEAVADNIQQGWLGFYYQDEGQREPAKGILQRYEKEVFICGKTFKSLSEAGRILNINFKILHKRIYYGWEGYYYTQEGQRPKRTVWGSRTDKVPVKIYEVFYDTIAEAARRRNESYSQVSKYLLSSNFPDYIRLDGKVDLKSSPPKYPEEVSIKGKIYPSIAAASREYSVSPGTITYNCGSTDCEDWFFTNSERQSLSEFTPKFSSAPCPVVIKGVNYPSYSAAGRHFGIDASQVREKCMSSSYPEWINLKVNKRKTKDGKPGLLPVKIKGMEYRSVNMACKETGIARETIKKRILEGHPDYCYVHQ